MKNISLQNYFPVIRTRREVINEIHSNPSTAVIFSSWEDYQQEEFLSICTGTKGVKMLFDSFFKEILNPESDPERLSYLLSVLMNKNVKVRGILPNDSTRLGDEHSLIITDIVVELEDRTIANVEVQKIGYLFTGERASCYSADLLLRQYKRIRDKKKKQFTYKELAPVYTIVFMETSPEQFWKMEDIYLHYFRSVSDTGLNLNMLQHFIFVPIDIFMKKLHNEGIQGELDAWLTFLGCDEPEYIMDLISKYPYFKSLYDDLYDMCLNIERITEMFSKELQILDRNTAKYMFDQLQEKCDALQEKVDSYEEQLTSTKKQLSAAASDIEARDKTIAELRKQLSKYEK